MHHNDLDASGKKCHYFLFHFKVRLSCLGLNSLMLVSYISVVLSICCQSTADIFIFVGTNFRGMNENDTFMEDQNSRQ